MCSLSHSVTKCDKEMPIHVFICLSICPYIHPSVHPPMHPPTYLSIHPSIHPSIHLFSYLSIIYLSIYLYIYLDICICVLYTHTHTHTDFFPSLKMAESPASALRTEHGDKLWVAFVYVASPCPSPLMLSLVEDVGEWVCVCTHVHSHGEARGPSPSVTFYTTVTIIHFILRQGLTV